jgi:NAD kinase/nicotinic acid mononucleotide adenylyltransferase
MPDLTAADIRDHIAALALPPGALGELTALAERLCAVQQTLAPVSAPRRLVLFAADHGAGAESDVGPAVQEIASGAAATPVLASATHTDLVLVDVGVRSEPLREGPHYRARRVRSTDAAGGPPLTADEFRAAFAVGQKEADLAAGAGAKLVAADAVGDGCFVAVRRVLERVTGTTDDDTDPVPALAEMCGTDLAAAAGLFARATELGLTVLACDGFATAAVAIAERLYSGSGGRCLGPACPTGEELPPAPPLGLTRPAPDGPTAPPAKGEVGGLAPHSDGVAALLTFQQLDAAAAVVARTARRVRPRDQVVAVRRRKVALFTGSFDPPTTFHRRVAKLLRARGFDEVIVRPNGPRPDGAGDEHAQPIHRAVMADLAFRDLPGVSVDLSDLNDRAFTPHVAFDDLHADRGEVWHVVSDEFIAGGRHGRSAIHTKWECGADVWSSGRFVVLHPSECAPDPSDLPVKHVLIEADGHVPTADIRTRVFQGGAARPDVPAPVEAYIRRYGLFSGRPTPRETRVRLSELRLKLVYDERNAKARGYAEQFGRYASDDPTHVLVLGGDGTMLQAIRDHWRLRLPFVGLNAGTLGFLMNESLPVELAGSELVLYRMPMLRVDTEAPDGRRSEGLACGDAWVERESGQAAWLRVSVDGRPQVSKVVGDGLLVATPAGASSYARAMGATPVPLTAPVLTLAGSNVFLPRFWRPVTLPEASAVTIAGLNHNNEPGLNDKRPLRGYVDGRPTGRVRSMDIRVSTIAAVELAFTPEFDLAARLLRSMFPPEHPV